MQGVGPRCPALETGPR